MQSCRVPASAVACSIHSMPDADVLEFVDVCGFGNDLHLGGVYDFWDYVGFLYVL